VLGIKPWNLVDQYPHFFRGKELGKKKVPLFVESRKLVSGELHGVACQSSR
jgi:hypothetical protein